MKKSIILLALVVAFSTVNAQKGKVTSAQTLKDSGKLDKALEAITEASDASNPDAEKTFNWPKTWQVRGEVYQAIGQSKDENFKKLSNDPFGEAFNSYKKAMELDPKHAIDKSIKMNLVLLTNDFTNQAVQTFESQDYNKALLSFENILEINNMPVIKADNPNAVDTIIIFNAALAAYNAEKYDVAVKYYKEAAKYGYNGGRTYTLMANAYQMQKDTISALECYREGVQKYPDERSLLEGMIQIYMDLGKTDEALSNLDKAIAQDPTQPRYHFAKGALYEKMGEEAKAIETYTKTIEVDSKFFNSYYNLGALYYNKGVQQMEVAKNVPPNENARYETEMKKADEWFAKALPYMEKCNELQAGDKMVLESLKNLYYRLKQMDKYNAVLEQINKAQ
jgi:tetratricopeptide (TPR) repeat protein